MKAGHTQSQLPKQSPSAPDFLGHFLRNFLTAGSSACLPSPAQAAIGPGLSSILNPAAQPPDHQLPGLLLPPPAASGQR